MKAAASPDPRPPESLIEGWLTPRLWRLADASGPADAPGHRLAAGDSPLLRLIDGREPLPADGRARLLAMLAPEERRRHDAYRLEADRHRFLLGRAGLRQWLAACLELPAEAVPLEAGRHGKPHCPGGPCFNVSHAGDLILLALHPSRSVGVDVEQLRPALDWRRLAQRVFSDSERLALERRPVAQRPEAFLESWCRLEARLKARGTGLVGLERLRQQDRQAGLGGSVRSPQPASADGGELPAVRGVSAAVSAGQDPPSQGRSAAVERLWNVHVPPGYRAAVALAAAGL